MTKVLIKIKFTIVKSSDSKQNLKTRHKNGLLLIKRFKCSKNKKLLISSIVVMPVTQQLQENCTSPLSEYASTQHSTIIIFSLTQLLSKSPNKISSRYKRNTTQKYSTIQLKSQKKIYQKSFLHHLSLETNVTIQWLTIYLKILNASQTISSQNIKNQTMIMTVNSCLRKQFFNNLNISYIVFHVDLLLKQTQWEEFTLRIRGYFFILVLTQKVHNKMILNQIYLQMIYQEQKNDIIHQYLIILFLLLHERKVIFFTSFFARDKTFEILLDVFVYGKQILPNEESKQHYSPEMVKQSQFGLGIQKMNQSIKADFIEHQNQIFNEVKLKKKKQNNISTYQNDVDTEKVSQQEFTRRVSQNDDITLEQVQQREKIVMKTLSQQNDLQSIGQTVLRFPGLNAIKALRLFDSGQQIYIHGKIYQNFMKFFKQEIMKRKNVKISRWSPNLLEYLNTSNIKSQSPLEFTRDIEEIVKLQKTGIPFMPKQASSRESQRLFLISKDKYIVQSYVKNSGAPYADSFHNNGRRIVETISQNCIKVTVSMQTVFKKKPFIGSLIEQKCEQEGIKQQKIMFDAMKDYLKNLQENKIKK